MDTNGTHLPDRRPADDPSTRRRAHTAALAGLTVVGVVLCVVLAYPFLPALTWAVALAIIAYPLHRRVARVVHGPNAAAGVSTAVVVAVILVPVGLIAAQLGAEAAGTAARAQELTREGRVDEAAGRVPHGREAVAWVRQHVDVEQEARGLVGRVVGGASAVARGTAWAAVQFLVCVFVLFFALRDARHLRASAEGLSPLPREEADGLLTRISDSVHATVYATVMVNVVQGVTGGLLFWALGLPAPVLWGW